MHSLTITLNLEELMRLPGDAVIQIITKVDPGLIFLHAAYDHENRPLHGKGRWPVNNFIRQALNKTIHQGCAACDRVDYQLGHADGCPKA